MVLATILPKLRRRFAWPNLVVAAQLAGSTNPAFPMLGVVVCVGVRLIGVRFGVNLASPPAEPEENTRVN